MTKKEYIKPVISVVEMAEGTSIMAGSGRSFTVNYAEDEDFLDEGTSDPTTGGTYGWGNSNDKEKYNLWD